MKQRIILSMGITCLITAFSSLSAGPIKNEYYKVVDQKKNAKDTPEKRKAQLEETLVYAMRMAMHRLFNDPDASKITVKDFQYERSDLNPYMYYIKYKNYIGYFIFPNNPEYYLLIPAEQKFLDKSTGTSGADAASKK